MSSTPEMPGLCLPSLLILVVLLAGFARSLDYLLLRRIAEGRPRLGGVGDRACERLLPWVSHGLVPSPDRPLRNDANLIEQSHDVGCLSAILEFIESIIPCEG